LVLASLDGDDIILCQITSQFVKDNYSIVIESFDFEEGSLNKPSNIRPNRLFTAEKSIVIRKIGTIKPGIFERVTGKLFEIINHKIFPRKFLVKRDKPGLSPKNPTRVSRSFQRAGFIRLEKPFEFLHPCCFKIGIAFCFNTNYFVVLSYYNLPPCAKYGEIGMVVNFRSG